MKNVIQGNTRIRQNHTLSGGVGNVALVPESHIFQADQTVGSDYASYAADAFGDNWVPFVRHCARAFLAHGEPFLSLVDFRPLPVTNIERKLVERRCDDGQRAEVFSVAIALNDL